MVWLSGAFLRSMVAAGCWAPAKLTTDVKARMGNSRRMRVRRVIGLFCSQMGGAYAFLTLDRGKKSAEHRFGPKALPVCPEWTPYLSAVESATHLDNPLATAEP